MSAPEFPHNPAMEATPSPTDSAGGAASALRRFMGGPPLAVLVRLLFVSLVVGALLIWLNVRPYDVFFWIQRFFNRLWMLGWDAVREAFEYVLAGAAIVVPVWLIMRLFNMRGPR